MLTEGIKEQWNMMKVKEVEWLRGNDGKEDGKKKEEYRKGVDGWIKEGGKKEERKRCNGIFSCWTNRICSLLVYFPISEAGSR